MKKQTYQKPDAEIIRFENEDIITASGTCKNKHGDSGCDHGNHKNSGQWSDPEE